VAEEADNANHDQDAAAEDDVGLCESGSHSWMWRASRGELMVRGDTASRERRLRCRLS
jgi:hypothetical protein